MILPKLGSSDHRIVLMKPLAKHTLQTGSICIVSIRRMGAREKTVFSVLDGNNYSNCVRAKNN